ncbi:hypothetical protein [Sphingopyxis indica]|uniref:Uncharacterized protein n=1 Tax=Sphingopyxis indica TaxID=436663 RepID=A0A239LMD8_9SPHN|nr:hypothetical protein [Sphingopyxis indica]SNT30754.1 hypothetical protein SAMN06295955_1262 [Sphingopyxis indica]
MRFSPRIPPRRPSFGRRQDPSAEETAAPRPDPDDRRLIDRLISFAAKRERA